LVNAKRARISKVIGNAIQYDIRTENLDLIAEFAVSMGCDPRVKDHSGLLAHEQKIALCNTSIPPYTDDLLRRKRSKITDALKIKTKTDYKH